MEIIKFQKNDIKTTYAIEVYHRLGFFNTDEELTVSGIRFTPMSYLLK